MADDKPGCVFCVMGMRKLTDLGLDLRVTLKADEMKTLYAEVDIPTCEKHEHIYIIHTRSRA